MIRVDRVKEYEALLNAYEREGLDTSLFGDRIAAIIISGSKIIGLNNVPGVEIKGEEVENGVRANIRIADGIELPFPIHLCTGYLKSEGYQRVEFYVEVGKNSKVKFTSHCIFPYAKDFTHEAISKITVGENSSVVYDDEHVHGEGVRMISRTEVDVKDGGRYTGKFTLTKHRARELRLEVTVKLADRAVAELTSKVRAVKDDSVEVREILMLEGAYSRGNLKSTAIAFDRARVNVVNEAYGVGNYARGHVECHEVVKGEADVQTVPLLRVRNDKAELTHEASIGRINEAQLVQLMAKGLTEEEAAELIIKGLLEE
ncbi:SufB/SufD family protein [Thermococcus waiotapuensis]|uniref:SufD family Fe-S cluster assembly protein n=1 Tax=Thermococcus waiotapuensis TaxID=90909 RepID=A0AAE4NVP1_9EURY|nr:SufD family Fe-S cluster assembly protein [Thermococcus waiotapuensis]MDV3103515.1 SufD family Fe-S cluster assembly protein [Thermococcus waiotapuensis]